MDDEHTLNLYNNTMTGNWEKVVKMYEEQTSSAIAAEINMSGDTAFHVAVSVAPDHFVEELINIIFREPSSTQRMTSNKEGNTPLHVASSSGRLGICMRLAQSDKSLGAVRNRLGESPLFLAAFHGHKEIFLGLYGLCCAPNNNSHADQIRNLGPFFRRNDGETVLHCAIRWEYFELAFEILSRDDTLAYSVNEQGITPLHLLASKPWVFRSGCHLGWWKNIIYYCIHVEELKHETALQRLIDSAIEELRESSKIKDKNNRNFPKNYQACIDIYRLLRIMAQVVFNGGNVHGKGRNADAENPLNVTSQSEQKGSQNPSEAEEHQFFRKHYAICFNILDVLYTIFIRIILGLGYEEIRKIKPKHKYSVVIMQMLIRKGNTNKNPFNFAISGRDPAGHDSWVAMGKRNETDSKQNGKGKGETSTMAKTETPLPLLPGKGEKPEEFPLAINENGITEMVEQILEKFPIDINDKSKEISRTAKTETPLLLAARNGIIEMVEPILKEFPLAINEKSEGQNIVLSAAKNRQTHVLQQLLTHDFVKRKLIHEVDTNENNALHLAAEIGKQKPWLIPGAALQMQWEIKWYEFVKSKMPPHFCYQHNKEGKTPEDIFNETHEELVKQGGDWLNKTSESCSVVAALIATVAFAASTTIPGDIDEKSGKPNLENQTALTIFAISSLVALCFSITALFSFLAILTSRYEQKDFRRDLPKKVLLGLTSLFLSVASMLLAFCAGHFFMLKNKLKDKAFSLYAVACLPIVFFAIQQLPLYVDIVWAIFKKVPRSSNKAVSL